MIVRKVRGIKLREYPIKYEGFLSTPRYEGTHVRNGIEVFAGPILSTGFQVVKDYGNISDFNVACLQYILASNLDVVSRKRMLLHVLQHHSDIMMDGFATQLHADPAELKRYLSIPDDVDLKAVCVANAYVLGKLPMDQRPAGIMELADEESPTTFVPKVHQWLKDYRAKARAKYKKEKK